MLRERALVYSGQPAQAVVAIRPGRKGHLEDRVALHPTFQSLRRIACQDFATVDNGYAAAKLVRFGHVVGGEHQAPALLLFHPVAHKAANRSSRRDVEPRSRFVEKEY